MSRILVSGSNGFIGSEVLFKLQGESIPRKFLYGNELDKITKGAETVIHCAAYGNMGWQKENLEIFEANVLSTFNLLESCRRSGVKNFIFIGSSSEYGEKKQPMMEEMLPETKTMYGCTKVSGTYLTRHYSQYFNTVTVRPFSIYGEREDSRRFIPTLIDSIKFNKHFVLQEGKHDWMHVDDFVLALEIILKNIEVLNGLVINVGSGKEITNEEVLETIHVISGKCPNMEYADKKKTDSSVWVANNSKMKSLGWKPRINLYEGLKRVYEYRMSK